MSMYSQAPSHYGHVPSYPVSQYGQPHHGGYAYNLSPPPPPPMYPSDPHSFRREFMARLADLTFNSRPMIQALSCMAQDFVRWADIVAQCLETHIRRVAPPYKLPAFYVLDAISKNVYDPYARHFADFIIPLFLDTYNQVDQNTRAKMEEMLITWRTGSLSGRELFGVGAQVNIERGVWGGGESSRSVDPRSGFHSGTGQISKAQVLSELDFTLGQKQRAVQANPYDEQSQKHIAALHGLRNIVEQGVSQQDLRQILDQLRNLAKTTAPPAAPPARYPPQQFHAAPLPASQAQFSPPPQPSYPTPPQNAYPSTQAQPFGQPSAPQYDSFSPPKPATPPVQAAAARVAADVPMLDISSILQNLKNKGILSSSSTPQGVGTTAKEEEKPVVSADPGRAAKRAYRKSILSQNIRLATSDMTKKRPEIVRFLYNQLPAKCRQCGSRFAEDVEGRRAMQDHLDMHFRQNRKANQSIGRGHSRSNFVSVDDWVHDVSDAKGKGRADGSGRMNAKDAAAAEAAKRDAELRALYVVVPPGDEAKNISCPICKETLKSEFLEDDEDWVWKNAIMKDEKVYHATCHAEAVASTNTLAARLRSEAAQRSRSGTPDGSSRGTPPKGLPSALKHEVKISPSPSPDSNALGAKRKAEKQDVNEGSPVAKKQAVSASA